MEKKAEKPWIKRLRNKYRLVVMHDETFEVKTSAKLSLLNVFIIISTIFVVFTVFILSVIILTPIKNYIVGYEKVTNSRKILKLEREADSLLQLMDYQEAYVMNIRKILHDEVDTVQLEEINNAPNYDELDLDKVSEEDLLLREQVANEDLFNLRLNAPRRIDKDDIRDAYFFPPVTGVITDGFNPEDDHYGVDVVAKENTPVKAVADGMVVDAYWNSETGNVIVIQHGNNLLSIYKHNSDLLKRVGNFVKAGDAIAIIGNTGELSTGPHLHFELWHETIALDPENFIIFN